MRIKSFILLLVFLAQFIPAYGLFMSCCQEISLDEAVKAETEHVCCESPVDNDSRDFPGNDQDCCGDDCHCVRSINNITCEFLFQPDQNDQPEFSVQNHTYTALIDGLFVGRLLQPPALD